MVLSNCKKGQFVRVVSINGEGALKRRIMDMGVTKGVEIKVKKFAPLGDPIEIHLRGFSLTLRKMDALMIEVELIHNS